MERFIVFFVLLVCLGCKKDGCYDCTQNIKIYTNRIVKGYPKSYKTKFIAYSENIEMIDTELPYMESDTIGDTIFTFWRDTECVVK